MAGKGRRVPQTRIGRFSRMVRMATGVAGGMLVEGGRRLASGEIPTAHELLATPGNVKRIAEQLAELRGAAMKVGQLLSMDAGDLLPPELADILARLRQDAQPIPVSQLRKALDRSWGKDWQQRLEYFDWLPTAAASIGQVHRAVHKDGRELAIKVQYPGIARSIDSDVDNVVTLLRIATILPAELDLTELLDEAKRQLHQEADYLREAKYMERFYDLLADDVRYVVPVVDHELTRKKVLAMSFAKGVPVESLADSSQALRDRVVTRLVELQFRELFEFRLVQTDPNFANFLYDRDSDRVVLLDFGATRRYTKRVVAAYRSMFLAALDADRDALSEALHELGYFADGVKPEQLEAILEFFMLATEPLRHRGKYDFAESGFAMRVGEAGMVISFERGYWHTPPADAIFLHRKLGGMFLLASRLGARIDIRALLEPQLDI